MCLALAPWMENRLRSSYRSNFDTFRFFFHLKRVQFYKTFHHFFKLKPISFSAPPPRYFSLLILILNLLHLIILSLLRTFIDYNYIYISIYNYLFLFVLWNNTYTRDKNFLPLCKNMYHFPRFTRSSIIFLYFFFSILFFIMFFSFWKTKRTKKKHDELVQNSPGSLVTLIKKGSRAGNRGLNIGNDSLGGLGIFFFFCREKNNKKAKKKNKNTHGCPRRTAIDERTRDFWNDLL